MNIKKALFSQQRLAQNKFWCFATLSTLIAVLGVICPVTAQAAGTTTNDTDFLINISRRSIEIILGILTTIGITLLFIGVRANVREKLFPAYSLCFIIFSFGLVVSVCWGFAVGPFDWIISDIAVLNAAFLICYLFYA